MAKIVVNNLSKTFGTNQVLNNVSFKVERGQSYVIMGGSGTGKSVLIKCILGLFIPDAGSQIFVEDEEITFLPIFKRIHLSQKSGVLFQGGALFDSLKVWENVCFRQLQTRTLNKKDARDKAADTLAKVGLGADVLDLFPAELSGGMMKRVALARAISTQPEVIFFDEPTAGLDPIMSGVISELIKESSKELGATTITITHDMNCARRIADECALIHKGQFIWQGKGSDIDTSDNPYINQFVHGTPEGPMQNSGKKVK